MPHAFLISACASGIVQALLLPVLLVLPPGVWGWWALLLSPELQAPLPQGKGMGGTQHLMGASAVSGIVSSSESVAVGLGGEQGLGHLCSWREGVSGPMAVVAQILEGMNAAAAEWLESCASPTLLLPGSLELQAQLLCLEDQDCRYHLCCFTSFVSSMCFSLPTFRCTDV